jgi:isocitrate/isopropylmalate dehydrogenase
VLEGTASGVRTPDLGGPASTTDVAEDVCRRVATKLEVWSALGTSV